MSSQAGLPPIEPKELFRALELAHYARRFKHALFVIALDETVAFADLMMDLKILEGYQIQVLVVASDPKSELEATLRNANQRGMPLDLLPQTFNPNATAADIGKPHTVELLPDVDFERLKADMQALTLPVITCHNEAVSALAEKPPVPHTYLAGAELAQKLQATKLFLLGTQAHPLVDLAPRSHFLLEELSSWKHTLTDGLADHQPLLRFIENLLQAGVPDVVLAPGRPGEVFREVFTHDGAGLLFNQVNRSRIRIATPKDITGIMLLLHPELAAKRLRPVSEDQVERDIGLYMVYEIDGLMIGTARLKPYGDQAELAQFATLPRYRGQGRAKHLAEKLVQQAQSLGLSAVFALSVDSRMWEFFIGLGFKEVTRESLPEDWKTQYDFSRPSKAFKKIL